MAMASASKGMTPFCPRSHLAPPTFFCCLHVFAWAAKMRGRKTPPYQADWCMSSIDCGMAIASEPASFPSSIASATC